MFRINAAAGRAIAVTDNRYDRREWRIEIVYPKCLLTRVLFAQTIVPVETQDTCATKRDALKIKPGVPRVSH